MPKYWGKQIFCFGSFSEVGQKQQKQREERSRLCQYIQKESIFIKFDTTNSFILNVCADLTVLGAFYNPPQMSLVTGCNYTKAVNNTGCVLTYIVLSLTMCDNNSGVTWWSGQYCTIDSNTTIGGTVGGGQGVIVNILGQCLSRLQVALYTQSIQNVHCIQTHYIGYLIQLELFVGYYFLLQNLINS